MFEPIDFYQVIDIANTPVSGLAYRLAGGKRREAMIATEMGGRRLFIHLDPSQWQFQASFFGPSAPAVEAMVYVQPKIEVDPTSSISNNFTAGPGDLLLQSGRASIAALDTSMGFARDVQAYDLWDTGFNGTGTLWYKRWRFVDELHGEVRVLREFDSTAAPSA